MTDSPDSQPTEAISRRALRESQGKGAAPRRSAPPAGAAAGGASGVSDAAGSAAGTGTGTAATAAGATGIAALVRRHPTAWLAGALGVTFLILGTGAVFAGISAGSKSSAVVDGLLHITDMSWGRIKHPSELFSVGDEIKVKILKYDREKERVSLGLKQVSPNPWDEVEYKFPVGVKVKGKVVSLKDYGAFIELDDGIEGLIHVSEMSWTERVKHPSKVLKVGDEVETKVLEVDPKNKRISLGMKQLLANPWDELEGKYPVGTIIEEGAVKSITDFGLFVDVGMGIDGLVHVSDLSWNKKFGHPSEKFKKGDVVRAVVLGIDKANEKFSLGIKQLERDPWDNIKSRYRQGDAVDGVVTKLADFGAFVELEEGVEGLIYVSEIADHRVEKPADILNVGDKVRAEILTIEPKERRIGLSIKQLAKSEERQTYQTYVGEKARKTSMGDILGDKLRSALDKKEGE